LPEDDAEVAGRLALALPVAAQPAATGCRLMRRDGLIRLPRILHDRAEVVQSHGIIGAVVAARPAVALVGSYELLMVIIRSEQRPADTPAAGPHRPADPVDRPVEYLPVRKVYPFAPPRAKGRHADR
jgi:hypothetical protein